MRVQGHGRRLALALIAAAFAWMPSLPAAAQTRIRFSLDWRFEGPAALFLHGLDKGYFREEGLDVAIEPGAGSREPVQRVANGGFDMGFGDVNTLIRFRDQNPAVDLKAVMMVYDRPPFSIVGRKSRGVSLEARSLMGKRLGAPAADGAFAQWPIFKAVNKLDDTTIKLENVGFPVREPMLASGEVDAIFGFAHSTFISLKARGVPVDDIVVLLMADYGVELYGNAIMANPKFLAEKPEAVRGFLRAFLRSAKDVIASPELAIDSVLKRSDGLRKEVEIERLKMAIDQYVNTDWVKANGFGAIDRGRWDRAAEQIAMTAPFRDKARAIDAFTDAFLPGAADRKVSLEN